MNRGPILLAAGMIVAALCPVVVKAADGDDEELRFLRAENKMLKAALEQRDKEVKTLKEELEQQKKVIAKLAARVPVGLDAPATQASQPTAPTTMILYKGKERTSDWFDDAFKKYGRHFAMTYDGETLLPLLKVRRRELEYLLVGKTLPTTVDSDPPEIGGLQFAYATVVQVLKDDEVLATVREEITGKRIWIHIKGVDRKLTDGATVPAELFQYLGPYSYVNAQGIKNTVQSYGCCRPPTKEEFAAGLLRGVVLKSLDAVPVKPNYRQKDWQKGLVGRGDFWFRIVETEAP